MNRRQATIVLIVGSLTACGAGPAAAPAPAPNSEPVAAPHERFALADEQTRLENGAGLLYARLGVVATDAERATYNIEFESRVAECMKERGFEYIPWPTQPGTEGARLGGLEVGSTEFVSRYGFAVVQQLALEFLPEPANPNDVIVAALDTDARFAYENALMGPIDGPAEEGCRLGTSLTMNPTLSWDEATWERFNGIWAEITQAVVASKAWEEYGAEMQRCLEEGGYPGTLTLDGDGFFGGSLERHVEKLLEDEPDPLELQRYEIGLASTALECGYFGEADMFRRIGNTLSEPILEAHAEDMETLLEAIDPTD